MGRLQDTVAVLDQLRLLGLKGLERKRRCAAQCLLDYGQVNVFTLVAREVHSRQGIDFFRGGHVEGDVSGPLERQQQRQVSCNGGGFSAALTGTQGSAFGTE